MNRHPMPYRCGHTDCVTGQCRERAEIEVTRYDANGYPKAWTYMCQKHARELALTRPDWKLPKDSLLGRVGRAPSVGVTV